MANKAKKPPKRSSGTLLYRPSAGGSEAARDDGAWEVLLVHPSGNYNRHKPWSIPKGIPDDGEALEEAARRETREEADVVAGELTSLGEVTYRKSGKVIYCFAGPAPSDARPRCACWEVDRAEFLSIEVARDVLHPDQLPFLDRLLERLAADV